MGSSYQRIIMKSSPTNASIAKPFLATYVASLATRLTISEPSGKIGTSRGRKQHATIVSIPSVPQNIARPARNVAIQHVKKESAKKNVHPYITNSGQEITKRERRSFVPIVDL